VAEELQVGNQNKTRLLLLRDRITAFVAMAL
jgi:hypothetical protein